MEIESSNAWKESVLNKGASARDALTTLEKSPIKTLVVVDDVGRLLGTITDGDIRRAILRGVSLDDSVQQVMNTNPIVSDPRADFEAIMQKVRKKRIHHLPVVDHEGKVIGIQGVGNPGEAIHDNWILLMAGGLGSRLGPLTHDIPKSLLSVGSKPLLEIILETLVQQGFRKFYISVNYKAEMIQEWCGDGSKWGAQIRYLHEPKKLGTAGALSLLPEKPTKPLLVMNGDLLTKVNLGQLLHFHESHGALATMCVRQYDFQLPYGLVKLEKYSLLGIDEKPVQRHFVNAGIYVLNPEAVDYVPKDTYFDMPKLFDDLIAKKHAVTAFPILEYWLDIGRSVDFEKANSEISTLREN